MISIEKPIRNITGSYEIKIVVSKISHKWYTQTVLKKVRLWTKRKKKNFYPNNDLSTWMFCRKGDEDELETKWNLYNS